MTRLRSFLFSILLSVSLCFSTTSYAKNTIPFNITTLVDGLHIPWGMAFISNNQLLITEREGFLSLFNLDTHILTDISGLPDDIFVRGQGGLLDVAIPPTSSGSNSNWIYFSYSKSQSGLGVTVLARAKLLEDTLVDWQDLFVSQSASTTSFHFGGRITFDRAGHVFLSVGDRGQRHHAQDLSNHAGTIVRLKLDGSVPDDNPFVSRPDALNEIWSYGHRNPQGLFYNFNTGLLWSGEHGPRGGDEINLVKAGLNYGWPVISYGKEYMTPFAVGEGSHKAGMEQPIKYYVPSIAPSSLIQYTGKAFPTWQGKLFSGALKLHHLNVITLDEQQQAINESRWLTELNARIRNVIEGPMGHLYLSTDSGKIIKLSPHNELK